MDPGWVNAIFNGLMTLIWLAYLNLFLMEFKSQRRTRVFLQLHGGYGLESSLRVLNMSERPVSPTFMQLLLEVEGDEWVMELSDADIQRAQERRDPVPASLRMSESTSLGSVRTLLERTLRRQTGDAGDLEGRLLEHLKRFRVRMVVMHGASDHPGAVERSFVVDQQKGRWVVLPEGSTQLHYSRRGRRMARAWMRDALER